jgi:hypothetical protein
MPLAPKQYRPHPTPPPGEYDRRRGTSQERGYGRRWRKYRDWYFSYAGNVLCSLESQCRQIATELDHVEAVDGPHDPRFFDPANTSGLCKRHHSLKTAIVDRGYGNARTPEGEKMLAELKQVAARRAQAMEDWDRGI